MVIIFILVSVPLESEIIEISFFLISIASCANGFLVVPGDVEFKLNKSLPAEKQIVTANPDISTVSCISTSVLFRLSYFECQTGT